MGAHDDADDFAGGLTRRAFLGYSAAASVPLVASVVTVSYEMAGGGKPSDGWPEFLIRREADEVFLKVRAVGFKLKGNARRITPVAWADEYALEFELPPQHFLETALTYQTIPAIVSEADLAGISLKPSLPSLLRFRVPRQPLRLDPQTLLDWSKFELIAPNPTAAGLPYDLEIPRVDREAFSRIELPWGMELAPAPGQQVEASGAPLARSAAGWTELWSTAIQAVRPENRSIPINMEIFSVRGFTRIGTTGSVDQGTLVVTYGTSNSDGPMPKPPTPLLSWERAELAASLCRRFEYTGNADPFRYSAKIFLRDENVPPFAAAYAPGRVIHVEQMRLSTRGGSLSLRTNFAPYPGSAVSGWTHYATLGQDHFVEVIREGFLFPFGTPCQLVMSSQRIFALDSKGRFVAPLNKQAFLRIPQPNIIQVEHNETPFVALSIATEKSPALDLPQPSGDPSEYGKYDYFLPMVGGKPFEFEHVGTDWSGDRHSATMPMIFVSNKARGPKGLIWEPGYIWPPDNGPASGDPRHTIPHGGEGLRVVDSLWITQPGRFASYGGAVVELAKAAAKGQAAQRLDWVEWGRGNIPDLDPKTPAPLPFRPRARTMRLRDQASGQLSGEPSALLATYRDVRFFDFPFLDPEPTTPAEDYFTNVPLDADNNNAPFVYYLESRPLVSEAGRPTPRTPAQTVADIKDIYFKVTTGSPPDALFSSIDNEISFGRRGSADGIGGLSVPDVHAGLANRRFGVVGDATFDERRWTGFSDSKAKLEAARRVDFAAYQRSQRMPLDKMPFQNSRGAPERDAAAAAARALMGYAAAASLTKRKPDAASPFAVGLKLGDLFGRDAELIPGMRFSDLFADVLLAGTDAPDEKVAFALTGSDRQAAAEPLSWEVRLSGIEWLSRLQESGSAPALLPGILSALTEEARPNPTARPMAVGMDASLAWSNSAFNDVNIGPAVFRVNDSTRITIDANAHIDFGFPNLVGSPPRLEFAPGASHVSAKTEVTSFAVEIFGAIRLDFDFVRFAIARDGSKSFEVRLAGVSLLKPLDFINQLQSMLGGLGGDNGIHVAISPQRAEISQTLNFPADGGILLMGPAQVTNLAFSWMVTIPLAGRGVLSVAFGLSSREKPLTIFVPPWYGGKAYGLIEATTRGCRLVEVSMEYGALVPIDWKIARGQASLTAGIFFRLERDDANDTGSVEFRAFIKAAANLSVAGIIRFVGLVYISLSYVSNGSGKRVIGQAGYSVSIKIGFVRVSYSFTAEYEKAQEGGRNSLAGTEALGLLSGDETEVGQSPFGSAFSLDAFQRVLAGYGDRGMGA